NFGRRGREGRVATLRPRPGGCLAAAVRRRLALSRDQPVTATTWSSNAPLSFFDAWAYCLANFVVTSAREAIVSSLPMPSYCPRVAGIFHVRHGNPFAGTSRESRRILDKKICPGACWRHARGEDDRGRR